MADPEKFKIDPRGVLRSSCTQCDCPCYGAGAGGAMKCSCGHPPGKHKKFGSSSESTLMEIDEPPVGSHTVQQAEMPPTSYYEKERVPECAIEGCTKAVYYDHRLSEGMQLFKYCSPLCRDKTLGKDKENLESDIKKLEQKLKSLRTVLNISSNQKQAASSGGKSAKSISGTNTKSSGSAGVPAGSSVATDSRANKPDTKSSTQTSVGESSGGVRGANKPVSSGLPDTKKSKSMLRQVKISKCGKEDLGLLFSSHFYRNNSNICGMIITGVKWESSVYNQFQNDKIHLLDIVTSIDGTAVSEGTSETYYPMIADNLEVTLDLNRLIGIPPMSEVLAHARHNDQWTHVFALRCAEKRDIGISLTCSEHKVIVSGVEEESIGRTSKLQFKDAILMYATATDRDVGKLHSLECHHSVQVCTTCYTAYKGKLEKEFLSAKEGQTNILLFVQRSEHSQ